MPYSVEALYTGDGATTQFGIEFEYQEEAHVHVTVDGAVVPFSFFAPSTILITPAPTLGAAVHIWRETPIDALNHEFQLGAPFLPAYIDSNNAQLLFATQESRVTSAGAKATAEGIAATAQEALDTANLALETTQAAGVAAFNGRTGIVVPQAGDYNATQITRGASTVAEDITALEVGKQAVTAELTSLLGLPSAANKVPYYTSPDTFGLTDLTAFARALLAAMNANIARGVLELGTGATATLTSSSADRTAGRVPKNGDKQICSAWVNFDGTDTVTIRDSYNVSSVVDTSTGTYTVNFTSPMSNTDYSVVTGGGNVVAGTSAAPSYAVEIRGLSLSSFTSLVFSSGTGARSDRENNFIAVFGGK